MNFILASTFQTALTKLSKMEQRAVKLSVFDLQQNPSNPGFRFHRIDNSKDPNFWSVRVNDDIRLVVHRTKSSLLIAYVDHHDDAYKWAERRRIDTHPKTGAAQIVEVREKVEENSILNPFQPKVLQETQVVDSATNYYPPLFHKLSYDELLSVGVPEDWVEDIHNANDENFLELAKYIPDEATESLLDYISNGVLELPEVICANTDPFNHPDSSRRFRVMDNIEELEQALNYPWDKWVIYLHPDQKQFVESAYSGPTRISGAAGTGKTVVALHRTVHILQKNSNAKVLLTTYSNPLSNALEQKLKIMIENNENFVNRVSVSTIKGIAVELFTLINGYKPKMAKSSDIINILTQVANELKVTSFSDRFLFSEWQNIIDAWQVDSLETYANLPRLGRRNRLVSKQREILWPVFKRVKEFLDAQMIYTPATICRVVESYYKEREDKPFSHSIVDEAQDLGIPELRMISVIVPEESESLFFVGDLGQRIFQEPFSWLKLGIDIRGRSHTLKVNYRTSHQIRLLADKLMPEVVCDVDGVEQDRSSTVSLFNGPPPIVLVHDTENEEVELISVAIIEAIDEGIPIEEIGIFVRSENQLPRARKVVNEAGQKYLELSNQVENREGHITIGTMHLAKGLEFRLVIVIACDDQVLPDQDRILMVADEVELDEVYDTERHLFYVTCTRAREKLIVSGVNPASEFFADIRDE